MPQPAGQLGRGPPPLQRTQQAAQAAARLQHGALPTRVSARQGAGQGGKGGRGGAPQIREARAPRPGGRCSPGWGRSRDAPWAGPGNSLPRGDARRQAQGGCRARILPARDNIPSSRHPRAGFQKDAGCWGWGWGAAARAPSGPPPPRSWVVGNWSRCSRSCDAGVRSRSVVCQRRVSAAEEKALDDSACPQPRPPVLEACQGPACPPEWAALDWSEVSRPCPPAPTPLAARREVGTGVPAEAPLRSHERGA